MQEVTKEMAPTLEDLDRLGSDFDMALDEAEQNERLSGRQARTLHRGLDAIAAAYSRAWKASNAGNAAEAEQAMDEMRALLNEYRPKLAFALA